MSTNKTTNYQLNQWEPGDQVLREEFNSDNAKIDAALAGKGNCHLVHGTYVGTGDYGYFNGNTLTFDRRPLVVILAGYYTMLIPGTVDSGDSTPVSSGGNSYSSFTWNENTLRWECLDSTGMQLNDKDITYHYFALYED